MFHTNSLIFVAGMKPLPSSYPAMQSWMSWFSSARIQTSAGCNFALLGSGKIAIKRAVFQSLVRNFPAPATLSSESRKS